MGAPEDSAEAAGVVRARHEWSSTPPSIAVIETLSSALDRDPKSLGPLYEYVDPDALDALVASVEGTLSDHEAVVSFGFAGHEVTVRSGGEVAVVVDELTDR